MSRLTIEIDAPEDEALLLQLLPKLNGRVVEEKADLSDQTKKEQLKTFFNAAKKIAASGGVGESFGDPSEWQREVRSWDRVLDGREE
ncbi:hypothetical protein ACFSUS_15395 [Spirosoma soli]|uniref:DUF2281 domain-containing protein n=1 Tax=Spirosoma soli TaxID=1770529 RepID=A0ABW5M4S7_9BACT